AMMPTKNMISQLALVSSTALSRNCTLVTCWPTRPVVLEAPASARALIRRLSIVSYPKLRIMNYELRITSYESNYELLRVRVPHHRFHIVDRGRFVLQVVPRLGNILAQNQHHIFRA